MKTRRHRKIIKLGRKNKQKTYKNLKVSVELRGNKLTLLHRGIRQKRGWVSINNNGFIYISRDKNRSYWILSKIEKKKRPRISFNDNKQQISVSSNQFVIRSRGDYQTAKDLLKPWI